MLNTKLGVAAATVAHASGDDKICPTFAGGAAPGAPANFFRGQSQRQTAVY